ncbi:VOC family protein [Actinomadura sp. 7K507]|uniref:VOC family protein n=1 Tax=Actinomadura sp. 7K507 TaxID=2530365 RepID=UPI001050B745|nr:VOC family protein [Actinomadura sp. 7K507]TDC97984.1 VOC family protein [Actinomadura sp. 7K507]
MRAATGWYRRRYVDMQGMPSWADLASPDLESSKAFYRGLFGWDSYTLSGDTFGDYEVFIDGAPGLGVAGVQGLADDTQPPSWTCYFRVDDVDASVRTVLAEGGQARVDPTDIAHIARIALFADPEGAEFGVWQPGPSGETALIGDRSAARWVELRCRDAAEAERFYGAVFGWSAESLDDPRFSYTRWRAGGQLVAGMAPMDDQWPADHPSHWTPYFETADCDAATARAAGMGARIRFPPTRIDAGRISLMTDPTGARFGVIAPHPREDSHGGAGDH